VPSRSDEPVSLTEGGIAVDVGSDLEPVLERECPGDAAAELRGLLHDLGHSLATLSYLTDGMLGDPALPAKARNRLGLLEQELVRLLDLVKRRVREHRPKTFAVRDLLEQVVTLTALSTDASIRLLPGQPVMLRTDKTLLWRMVTNLVDNAVRAAGPNGRVDLAVRADATTVTIEIADDGPGFGHGPSGMAALGIDIVVELAHRCGASLHLRTGEQRGTCACLVFREGSAH
jgi:signal transduction histidine kinase